MKCKFCNNTITYDNNFCPNCGSKTIIESAIDNKIDRSIDTTKKIVNNFRNEIAESKYVENAIKKTEEIVQPFAMYTHKLTTVSLKIIGFLGIIYIVSQILFSWFNYKETALKENWNYCTTRMGAIGFINDFSCFLGTSIFTIIIPFISILLLFKLKKIPLYYFFILIILYISAY